MGDEVVEFFCSFNQQSFAYPFDEMLRLHREASESAVSPRDFFFRIAKGYADFDRWHTDIDDKVYPVWNDFKILEDDENFVRRTYVFLYMMGTNNTDLIKKWYTSEGIGFYERTVKDKVKFFQDVDGSTIQRSLDVSYLNHYEYRPCFSNRQWNELRLIVESVYNKFGLSNATILL